MGAFSPAEVLSHIRQEFPRLVPLIQEWSFEPAADPDGAPGELLAQGSLGGNSKRFLIAGLGTGFPRPVRLAVAQLAERQERYPDAYPVVTAPYLGPHSAQICKDRGCGYVDLSGNCFLAFGTVYIREENHPNRFPIPARQKSLYTPRGSRVVRALLEHPTRAWRQKDLAELTRTSPAHVHKMVERLLQLDFVDREGAGPIRLREPGRLLDDWQAAYRVSEHRLHCFYRWAQTIEQVRDQVHTHLQSVGIRYAFTQEAAASLVAPYTAYDRVTVYLETRL